MACFSSAVKEEPVSGKLEGKESGQNSTVEEAEAKGVVFNARSETVLEKRMF